MDPRYPPQPVPASGMDKFRRIALPVLTTVSHTSSAFITTFLLIHLSAPVLGNAGSNLASQTMLLGREYYQTQFGEKYLVLGPIVAHAVSSCLKRLLYHPGKQTRKKRSCLTVTGYLTASILLPIHYFTHRVNPTITSAPISAVGPSELDYEFVKVGLQTWPVKNWLLYGIMVSFVTFHAVDGQYIILGTMMNDFAFWMRSIRRNKRMAFATLFVTVPVLSGLYVVSREPIMAFSSVAERYQAAFKAMGLF